MSDSTSMSAQLMVRLGSYGVLYGSNLSEFAQMVCRPQRTPSKKKSATLTKEASAKEGEEVYEAAAE